MTVEEAVAFLRQRGDRYCSKDGVDGDLCTIWGWRDIARHIHDTADELEAKNATVSVVARAEKILSTP